MGRSNTSRCGPLPAPTILANDPTLTAFAGAIPLIRFLSQKLNIVSRLSTLFKADGVRRIYPRHLILFAFMVGSLLGVHRLAHLEALRGDPVLLKFLRLPRWPVRKVFSSALATLNDRGRDQLCDLIADVGLEPVKNQTSAVIDVDSSSIISYGQQEGAVFGYSGKGRNRRRHHPLVASLAQTRTVIHADYRTGAAIKATEAIAFIDRAVAVLRSRLAAGAQLIVRADSGFWSKAMGEHLLAMNLPFTFVIPMHAGVKRMLRTSRWRCVDGDPDLQITSFSGERISLNGRLRIIGIRRRIRDVKSPPAGKTIAGCSRWRYQALVTSMEGVEEGLWRFYNDRADCERLFKVARGALGMGWLIGQKLRANETAFLLRLLAFNADQRFQLFAETQARADSRPPVSLGLIARQHRFYRTVGRLLKSQSRWLLRIGMGTRCEPLWDFYAPELVATG